jgi:hypothetical protein
VGGFGRIEVARQEIGSGGEDHDQPQRCAEKEENAFPEHGCMVRFDAPRPYNPGSIDFVPVTGRAQAGLTPSRMSL